MVLGTYILFSKIMHELGIVFYIIRDVKKAAQEHGVEHVNAVVMNIGEVSTVVPEYLTDCWRWAADKEDAARSIPPCSTGSSARTVAVKTRFSSAVTK